MADNLSARDFAHWLTLGRDHATAPIVQAAMDLDEWRAAEEQRFHIQLQAKEDALMQVSACLARP